MRKVLIVLLILLLLSGFGLMVVRGVEVGKFGVSSVKGIIDENEGLDSNIGELDKENKEIYEVAKANLNASQKSLQNSKQKYQDAITYSTEEEIKAASQTEKYKISFLWTKIGFHATKNNITMQANVSAGSIPEQYNISFTALGQYIDISEFIYAIENDSQLGFRIEDFELAKYSDTQLQAKFVIRNIAIDKESLNDAMISSGTQNNTTTTTTQNQDTNTVTEKVDHSNDINRLKELNEESHRAENNI